jgi:hypothetical protein
VAQALLEDTALFDDQRSARTRQERALVE